MSAATHKAGGTEPPLTRGDAVTARLALPGGPVAFTLDPARVRLPPETPPAGAAASAEATIARLTAALELVAACVEQAGFQAAATALATELATRLSAERVSVGFLRRGRLRVVALSHSARFGHRTDVIRDVEAAMHEATDQADTIVYPLPADRPARVTWAHAQLARRQGTGGVVSVPLVSAGSIVGALTAERPGGQTFDAAAVELTGTLAGLVGPLLEAKRRDERGILQRLWDAVRAVPPALLGPRHTGKKLALLAATAVAASLTVATGEFRIASRARIEGAVQRAVFAPVAGYVATANARAGDLVREGEVLATLEDKDLQLERTKWLSRREQLTREYHAAVAARERSQAAILRAQIDQAAAELGRLDDLLARVRLAAPFDGVVVSGDLSQSLGSPVERGQVLFELAPLDAYRVVLEVDERDITYIAPGQPGRLALTARPDATYPITVQKVTPVAKTDEGRSHFRVEASLAASPDGLRPRMDGVAKVEVGERRLLWVWTRRLTDGLALWLWASWP